MVFGSATARRATIGRRRTGSRGAHAPVTKWPRQHGGARLTLRTMSAAALATADLIAAARAPAAIDAGRIAHLVGRAAVGQTDRIVTKGVTGRRESDGRVVDARADAAVEDVVAAQARRVRVEKVRDERIRQPVSIRGAEDFGDGGRHMLKWVLLDPRSLNVAVVGTA